jgi:hypothetical protein
VQLILPGLNWNAGLHPPRFVQPVAAAVLPALSFAAFDQLPAITLQSPCTYCCT